MNNFLDRHKNYLKYLLVPSFITFVILLVAQAADAAWYDSNWQYRKKITIKSSEVTGGPHSNFPVLFSRSADAELAANARNDAYDILFTSDDEVTKIPHEIEKFDGATGELVAWVKVGSVSSAINTDIYMYYGYASAADQQDVTNVWDSNYVGVWHLDEEQAGTGNIGVYKDSTLNPVANHGDDYVDATGQSGKIGGGQQFSGNGDFVQIPHDASLNLTGAMTISFWIYPTANTGTYNRVVDKGYTTSYYFGCGYGTNDLTYYLDGTEVIDTADGVLTVNSWNHAAVSYTSGGNVSLFVNGAEIWSGSYLGGITGNTNTLYISHSDLNYDFTGFIDEVRISNTDRSSGWIQTAYRNQNNSASFISAGSQTSCAGNTDPTADPGGPYEAWVGNPLNLDGTATDGGDGPGPITITWSKVSGPGTVTFGDASAEDTTATFSTDGPYTLKLTVNDGCATAENTVNITVNPGSPLGLENYSCYMKITIDHTKVSGTSDLNSFPVLISLTDETLKNTGCGFVTSSTGDDIIFTNAAKASQLDHEIEKYDGSTGELVAWVRVPTLKYNEDTDIYVYYGNNNVTSPQENPTGVWDSNYVGVWHLQDQNNLKDSTSYSNNGSSTNVDDDAGIIEGAQDFDGNDSIDLGRPANGSLDFEENTDFCISAWFNADINTRNMTIVGQRRQTSIAFGIYDPSGDKIYFRMDDSPYHLSDNPISLGQWYHAAICYDYISGTIGYSYMYVNGVAQTTNGLNTYNTMDPDSWKIGDEDRWCPTCGSVGPDEYFDGDIDEVRISNTVRSADWFITSYNNQSNPSSFYSVEPARCPETTPPIAEFSCSIPITIDSSKVSGTSNLIDFPVLISLTDTALKTTANCGSVQNSNGYDIIFSDSTQTIRLDHEVDKYDGAAGQLVAWVRVPTLKYNEDTVLYIHFGHSSVCGSLENSAGVWDSNYTTVWHLKETSGGAGAIKDSTARANHGTDFNGPTFGVTGKIGNAVDFDGTADYATMPTSGFSTSAGTVELWTNIDTFPSTDNKYMFSHVTPSPIANRVYVNLKPDNTWGTGMGDTYDLVRGSVVSAGTWYHLVLTWDGTNVRGYKDGALNFGPTSYSGLTTVGNIYVSAWDGAGEWFDGTLDEVRVSNTTRSADWIQTSYNNQSDPTSFYSVGASSCSFLGGFSCNRKITIPNENVSGSGNLTDFPLLLKIERDCNLKTSGNGGNVQDSNGYDIIFTDSSGTTQLDHEIEEYDGVSGDLTAWVKVPTLSGSSDTDIYMYYGNSSLSCDPSNPAGVWSNNYKGVWHLSDTSGNTQDSTSYNTDGTLSGSVSRAYNGQIYNAFNFGTDGEVDWGDPGDGHLDFGTGEMTLSLWVNMDNHRGVWEQIILKGKSSWESGYQIEVDSGSNTFYFTINDGSYSEWGVSSDISFSLDTWTYVVGVVDRSNNLLRAYKNGVQVDTSGISSVGSINVNDVLTIGRDTWGWPDARIEEVRLSKTARSADWIKTEYDNQNDPASFSVMSGDTCGGQYGFNYQYCKKITVDHTQVNSDLTNFPLLINITGDSDLKTVANGGRLYHSLGYDIVFRSPSCGQLDHEIEKYDGSAGTLIAWVRVPTLSGDTDTEIYMYYADNNVTCSPENAPGVWDSNYVGVWHLDETVSDESTAGTHYDSTGYSNNGAQNDNDDTDGKIGTGQMFDGSSDWIQVPDSSSVDITGSEITLSAWVKSTADQNDDAGIVIKNNLGGVYNYNLNVQSSDQGNFRVTTSTGETYLTAGPTLTVGQWYFLYGIYNGSTAKLYLDGSEVGTLSRTGNILSTNEPVLIGRRALDDARYFTGVIDEVHISKVARSTDWMQTEYNNQTNPNFYSISSCFEQTTEVTEGWVEEVQ